LLKKETRKPGKCHQSADKLMLEAPHQTPHRDIGNAPVVDPNMGRYELGNKFCVFSRVFHRHINISGCQQI